jgi:plastocyanin
VLKRKLAVAVGTVGLVVGGSTAALAAKGHPAASNHTTVAAVATMKVKINRYVQDGMRWDRDVYTVKSGGTVTIVNRAPMEGPHSFSIVAKRDLPRTVAQINNCKICLTIAQEHGADPNSEAPPKFLYVENGQGTNTAPGIDRPGDSAFIPPKMGAKVTLRITAKPGTTLYFVCAVHPWMQAKLIVTK